MSSNSPLPGGPGAPAGPGPAGRSPVALSVAGTDSAGGAGLSADLQVFAAHRLLGALVVTAVTAQDSVDVRGVHAVPAPFVRLQLSTVLADLEVKAAKTGLFASPDQVEAVASELAGRNLPVVVDPVLGAGGGAPLGGAPVARAILGALAPHAALVTPNLPEAAELLGLRDDSSQWSQARRAEVAVELVERGRAAVLLKGGHSAADVEAGLPVHDLLVIPGASPEWLTLPRLESPDSHGTGCVLSAAITAALALGHPLREAVLQGRQFLLASLLAARPTPGRGRGSPNPLFALGPSR